MPEMFKNRPLTVYEREKLNEGEQKVIMHFERVTKNTFMRFDVPLLKKCIKTATPEAINALISQFYYRYPQNFIDFNYIVRPVTQGMLKSSRGGKKNVRGKK